MIVVFLCIFGKEKRGAINNGPCFVCILLILEILLIYLYTKTAETNKYNFNRQFLKMILEVMYVFNFLDNVLHSHNNIKLCAPFLKGGYNILCTFVLVENVWFVMSLLLIKFVK